jgi:guanylate kinase
VTPFPLILSSPSGGGKTTIARLLQRHRSDVGYSISCTTRPPRQGEVEAESYYFLSPDEFQARAARGDFAEHALVHGNWYGTLKSEVQGVLDRGKHVVMDIDVQGARQFVQAYPQSVLVFVLPPSADVLEARLRARGTENSDVLTRRLRNARDELREVALYQYVVLNDDLDAAYRQVSAIVDAEAVRHERIPRLEETVASLIAELDRRITGYIHAG